MKKTKQNQSLNRNDIYIIILGVLQIFFFVKFTYFTQQVFYIVSTQRGISYVFGILALISAAIIFGNLSNLVLAYSEDDISIQSNLIQKVGKASITVLVLLLFLLLASQIRF